jgi:long-chain fatty acid transport protein
MKYNYKKAVMVLALSPVLLGGGYAWAGMGIQQTAYSALNQGMGGAVIANPLDTLAAADNPAGMSKIGNRWDAGLTLLSIREDNSFLLPSNRITGHKFFPLVAAGFNYQLNPKTTMGLSFYSEGAGGIFDQKLAPIPNLSDAQIIVVASHATPSVSYKVSDSLAVGLGIDLALGMLKARGLVAPNGEAVSPDLSTGFSALREHGIRTAYGAGIKLGVLWDPLPNVSVGASYTSKVSMSRFSGYSEDLLLPNKGIFDLPEQYGLGISWKPFQSLTFAADYLRLNYAKTRTLGSQFGYRDVNVLRLGTAYDVSNAWTVRAGYTNSDQWSDPAYAFINTLGPTIQNRAATLGFTYHIDARQSVTGGLDYGIRNTITGTGASAGSNIDTAVNFFVISYARTL